MAVVTIKIAANIPDTDRKAVLHAEFSALDLAETVAARWADTLQGNSAAPIVPTSEVYVTVEPRPDTQPTKRGRKPRAQVPVQPLIQHAAE